jgi:hypothetical protein
VLEETLLRAGAILSDERAREAARLLDRWRARRFVALIVGEFKRGKSTLVNALVGRDLLPTGVPPVTAVPTRVSSGPRARAVARFRNGTEREIPLDEIRDYVDESRNPRNHRGVASVDVEVPRAPRPASSWWTCPVSVHPRAQHGGRSRRAARGGRRPSRRPSTRRSERPI